MEEEKISCIGCKRLFQHSGILRHLSSESAKDCKAFYTDEALESLKRASRRRRNQLDTERRFKKRQKLNPQLLSSKNESDVTSTDHKVSCKVCKRKFLESGILKHISNTENCKLNYPKKDLSDLYQKSYDRRALKYTSRKREQEEKEIVLKKKQINTEKCNVCLRFFKDTSILNHIAKSSLCQKVYHSKSFQKEMHRLEQISVNTCEIKLANWRKEHNHERLKYYNPRKRAEQYLKDKKKISGEYQQHTAFMKHKERRKKVADTYYQKKHKWASKEGKAFSVASNKVFENVWDSIEDRHLDKAIEKVRDDKDLHSKVLDDALENTMAWKWQLSFDSKYRDCDGLSRNDCDKALNPSNIGTILHSTALDWSEVDIR